MILVAGRLRRGVALALLGADMDQDRPLARVAHIAQDRDELVEIMAVDRADIAKAHLFKEGAAHRHAAQIFLGAARGVLDAQRLGDALAQLSEVAIALRADLTGEVVAHGAHGRGDGHVVVVQDDDQVLVQTAGVVHRLIGHARAHGAVADHGDDLAVRLPLEVAAHRKAEARRDGGRGVRRAERVVLALLALGEAGESAALAQRPDPVAPAGEDLVGIALVADIPDQDVVGRIEHVVQRQRQLDHAEPGAQMAAGHRDRIDHLRAQLVRRGSQEAQVAVLQIAGKLDLVEMRRVGHVSSGVTDKRSYRRQD